MQKPIKRVTRKDVAEYAGVTPTIVSYVINNNRYVDAGKRERVEKALKELGYRPNSMARALKGKQSNHILFIVDDLQSEYFGKVMKHMDPWAYDNDYFISLCESRNSESFVDQIYQRYFDGVIIASGTFQQMYIQKLIDTKIPVVLLEMRTYSKLTGNYALINSGLYDGARLCCKTLIEKGRRRILFVDSLHSLSFNKSSADDFRLRGFLDELDEHGLRDDSYYRIISNCMNEDDLYCAIKSTLEGGFCIDGVFGRTDSVAIQVMHKLIDMGYEVPKDCSVIGVNNSRISRYTYPKLATLDIDRESISHTITSILDKVFGEGEIEEVDIRTKLTTRLIKRESL